MEATNEEQSNESRLLLTDVDSKCSLPVVAKFKDIIAGLSRQTSRRSEEVAKVAEEMDRLREGYQRYRELHEWLGPRRESMKIGTALVLSAPLKVDPEADAFDPRYRQEVEEAASGAPIDLAELDLSQYPLWKIMLEIVKQVPEMRVYELESHLKTFGVHAQRTAIESALASHKAEFDITKRGREKFVSWKESKHAASTTRRRKH